MLKWYEQEGADSDVVVASRIRLQRNIKDYSFPVKLNDDTKKELNQKLVYSLSGLRTITAQDYDTMSLQQLSTRAKAALRERQLLSHSIEEMDAPVALMISKDESACFIFNGEDHIRLQVSKSGMNLDGAWTEADQIDDFINEKYEYAFDEKFGYLTTFPTHMGTGMRAYLLLHLPYLSSNRRFQTYINDITRFGIAIKSAYGQEDQTAGDMYVLYNQKTLGQSETDLIEVLKRIGRRLIEQERKLRELTFQKRALTEKDHCFRAYGLLKYARKLSMEEALAQLSILRVGQYAEWIAFSEPVSLFQLMQCCQPATLQTIYHRDLSGEELDQFRAEYIRHHLPACKEEEE